jgi:hypothetical protein
MNATDEKLQVEDEYDRRDRRRGTVVSIENGIGLNASGHKDQLKRQYGLLALCGLALNIDNAWIALGGSVTISIGEASEFHLINRLILTTGAANGGPAGVLYELIVACAYYAVVAACIAEVSTAT